MKFSSCAGPTALFFFIDLSHPIQHILGLSLGAILQQAQIALAQNGAGKEKHRARPSTLQRAGYYFSRDSQDSQAWRCRTFIRTHCTWTQLHFRQSHR
jgi:hypothetical protein